jgi:hypothetical protein
MKPGRLFPSWHHISCVLRAAIDDESICYHNVSLIIAVTCLEINRKSIWVFLCAHWLCSSF